MKLNEIYCTDVLTGLDLLPDASIDSIITSPPYWLMRDYDIPAIWWNAIPGCHHEINFNGYCIHCGGWLGQLGNEPVREEYIAHLVEIFAQCRRVLKNTGTLWVNLGDSYSKPYEYHIRAEAKCYRQTKDDTCLPNRHTDKKHRRIPEKSLCNIPGKFAEEMILDGWILRNEIIWHKPACMPSSAHDRFTVDFEKIFFFTQKPDYYFKQQFEPYALSSLKRYRTPMTLNDKGAIFRNISGKPVGMLHVNPRGRNMRSVWRVAFEPCKEYHFAMYPSRLVELMLQAGCPDGGIVLDPFMGAGTTALAARRLGRNFIGFEPNAEYIEMARRRLIKEESREK